MAVPVASGIKTFAGVSLYDGVSSKAAAPKPYVDLILHSALQLSRASGGTTEVSPGVYAQAAVNERRYVWMNGRRGLLIESAATNVLLYSDNLLASPWNRRGTASIVADGDGGFQLSGIGNYDGTSGNNDVYQPPAPVASGIYAMSLFMKRGTNTGNVIISTPSGEGFGAFRVNMALVGTTYERIALGHPAVTRTKPAITTTDGGMHIRSDNAGTFSVKGCQVELGTATSPIPTAAVAATRAPDMPTIATSAFGFNAGEGTFVFDLITPSPAPNYNGLFVLSGGLSSDRVGIHFMPSAGQLTLRAGDANQVNTTFTGTAIKIAFTFGGGIAYVSINGAAPVSVASASLSTVFSMLNIGVFDARLGGSIFALPYYPRKYTAAELQAASA